ncbi:hypothetical protein N7468_001211 [Penicillium chermesinum]|uniref:TPR domain protein n=1 Tax=Penicillium chermesinum TaxID=63820 RepID=A0A9W9PG51_9EURO|nr:uncharacterized protein N7468_001211 [Penicillium chermesinum]KAJ5246228.1 hypothetical protein N7468_001211 [Penicillium chermesinum]KAJ6144516.1 hypothetical protein N7470_008411 [Penicillium chermesinum]
MPDGIPSPLKPENYPYQLGSFGRPISTKSPEAQIWFNRGLTWTYTFNHEQAIYCFEQAIAHDATCAIAYWGIAYASGPNFNRPWGAFGPELPSVIKQKALIAAIAARYDSDEVADLKQYALQDVTYADAMELVYDEFEDDLDVAVVYADAAMNLSPWKLWDLVSGKPNPGTRTLAAKAALEKALGQKGAYQHPGLLHIYIHMVEMSPNPEQGLVASDHLRNLVPDAGHVLHMPSHLDVLVGDYRAAIIANQRAVVADNKAVALTGAANFYAVYRLHNYHTLIYAAMFAGQKQTALGAVDGMERSLPRELLLTLADYLEVILSVRSHVMVRFGMWNEIIALPVPDDPVLYSVTTATIHYAKGVAYAAMGNVPDAERQRELYTEAAKRVPETRLNYPNKCVDILGIASAMLDGEIEYRRGNYTKAFEHLSRAVELDDRLGYGEPWSWMQPARHAHAALLLEQGHVEDAAAVYRSDLGLDDSVIRARRHYNNVWALQGYHECLTRLGRTEEANMIQPQLQIALAVADVPVKSSCFCRLDTSEAPRMKNACSSGGCH